MIIWGNMHQSCRTLLPYAPPPPTHTHLGTPLVSHVQLHVRKTSDTPSKDNQCEDCPKPRPRPGMHFLSIQLARRTGFVCVAAIICSYKYTVMIQLNSEVRNIWL